MEDRQHGSQALQRRVAPEHAASAAQTSEPNVLVLAFTGALIFKRI